MVDNYDLFFHGRSDPGTGQISIGLVLALRGKVIDSIGGEVDVKGSQERAQWEALVQGMVFASSHKVKRIIMKGDSRSVINYMNGEPPRKEFTEMEYLMLARKKQLMFDQCFFQWIPDTTNAQAFNLARSAI